MENNPLVSIIINCYNSERYLQETIESVINQKYTNWELIFWDNQSSDNSKKILDTFCDRRIKYFYSPKHTSLGEARNMALKKISGKYFKFLDADDYLYDNCLIMSVASLDENTDILYTNSHIYYQKSGKVKINDRTTRPSGFVFCDWITDYNVLLPSVLIKSTIIERVDHLFDLRFSMIEEYDFLLRLALIGNVKYLNDVTCFWRKHSESLSFTNRGDWLVEFSLLRDKLISLYPARTSGATLTKMNEHIAYLNFVQILYNESKISRSILKPHINNNKKCLLIYISSFFGTRITIFLLNLIRKMI